MTVIPLLLFGCSEVRLQGKQGHKDHPNDPSDPPEDPSLTGPATFDPLFGSASLSLRDAPKERTVEVFIATSDGEDVLRYTAETDADGSLEITWDGRTDAGTWTQAGPHVVAVSDDSFEVQSEIVAVRAGAIEARLEGDGGVSAVREPLYWPIERELQDEGEEISQIEAIDDGEQPIDFPSAQLSSPVRPSGLTRAEPAAFVYDSRPLLSLTIAEESALGRTGLDDVEVTLSVEGFSVLSGNPLRPGGQVLLQRDEPLGDTVGVSSLDLVLSFSALGEPLGEQHLPLQIYRLLDVSQFEDDDDIYRPWVPVVDEALGAIEGTTAEPLSVLDALDAFVYYDLGLVYDTSSGASAYTEYLGWDWDSPHFYLSDFLQRRNGNVINCSDAGTILGAYANMVGARLDHVIIDPPFDLNYILAIGGTEFTSCPFGPWGCGFSYHAVTTHPGSGAIWDATLALDGDSDPGELPATELLVQTIDAEEYLDRLVRSGQPGYHSQSQETLQ